MSNSLKGTLLTVVAGIAWGLSGTSGQYLMAHGTSALVLTNLRLLIAGGILMLLAHATAKDKMLAFLTDKKSLLSLLIFALIGLFLNQFAYLTAIQETNAGTATVLQYVCPVGIVLKIRKRGSGINPCLDLFFYFFNNLGPLHTASNHNSTLFRSLPRKNFSDLGIKYSVDSNFWRRLAISSSLTKNLSIDKSQVTVLSTVKSCP